MVPDKNEISHQGGKIEIFFPDTSCFFLCAVPSVSNKEARLKGTVSRAGD
jgi:hypothetical protein